MNPPDLFAPVHLGALEAPNRMVMAPLTRMRAGPGRVPTALMAEYYAQRAAAGLIVNEATAIAQQGTGCPNSPGIYTADQVDGWRRVTRAVHQAGGRIFLQLWHMGRISHPSFQPDGGLPVAPQRHRPAQRPGAHRKRPAAIVVLEGVGPQKAALDVADYQSAISWASQTALRNMIGKTMLSDMLEGRDKISAMLQKIIDQRTEPWAINVISVEVKDVLIPAGLEDAMSMQAQAERERQARVILGDAERQIAEKFTEAGKCYEHNPIAFHLRAMNMLYEGLKENSTTVIVPSTAVESMQLGGLAGMTALTMGLGQDRTNGKADDDYPDFVIPLARAVAAGTVDRGIGICGGGGGASIAANKVAGVRAGLVDENFSAHQDVEDDDLNMICFGGLLVGHALAWELTQTFLAARFQGAERFRRRLEKVAQLECPTPAKIT
jgi:RpiB/LacA/LacB family sugar-phosphate isomerase